MVKKKMTAGKMARKKSKVMADALKVSLPSKSPLKKNINTVNKGMPSKPGSTILRSNRIVKAALLRIKVTLLLLSFARYLLLGSSKVFSF